MVKIFRTIIIIAYFIACFVCAPVFAGAWVQKAGGALNILSLRRYISDQSWTSGGRLISSSTYAKNEVDEYFEYGATDKLTLGFYLSALRSHTSANNTRGGVNDKMLLGRYLIWGKGSSVASVQLMIDNLGHAATFNVPPQNSTFNSGEAILIGTSGEFKSKSPQFWFADASFGLVQRYSAGNQFQVNLEAGYKAYEDQLWLMLQNYNTLSLDHINYPQGVGYNLFTLSPSVIYWPSKLLGLQLGMAQDIYGQNVGKGRALFISTWLRFNEA